jgi:phosphoglycolate phosphatase
MKAVIFDLDGTLIDSAPDIHAAANRMLVDEGCAVLDLATITSFIGNGLPKLVERVMQARGIDLARHGELSARVLDYYNAASSDLTVLYPGVEAMLKQLHAAGYRLGLCTNKPEAPARAILADFRLDHLFDAVIGGDSLNVKKPDAAPLLATGVALGADGIIYVGDSEVDAETARAAGLPFALFTEGYRKTPLASIPHDFAFSRFAALPDYVETQFASMTAA